MAKLLKTTVITAALLIFLHFITPIGVAVYYGGNPPPFLARMLERKSDTSDAIVLKFFDMFQGRK